MSEPKQPSGKLYSAITKYWPRIAVGLIAAVGVAGWLIEGLTADSGVEFYLMAWAATTGGVWFLFEKAERALGEEGRAKVVGWLRHTDLRPSIDSIPQQFAALFDRVFGERHWSRRCFNRSCLASLFSVLTVAGLGAIIGHPPDLPAISALEVTEAWYVPVALLILVIGVVPFNFLPDYASLLETRWAIRVMQRSGGIGRWLVLDLIATAVISFAGICVISVVLLVVADLIVWAAGESPGGPDFARYPEVVQNIALSVAPVVRAGPPSLFELLELPSLVRISFFSAFFTSAWLWVYSGSILLSRVLLRMNSGVGFLLRVTDVEKQPFRSMGFVSVIIVSGLFALGLPLVLL